MRKKSSATTRSRNGSSKINQIDTVVDKNSIEFKFTKDFWEKCEYKECLSFLVNSSIFLEKNLESNSSILKNAEEYLVSFNSFLNPKFKFKINPNEGFDIQPDNFNDFAECIDLIFISFFVSYAAYGINLELCERQNRKIKGLNKFLKEESPEMYEAYKSLSNQFGFNTTVEIVNKESLADNNSIRNSKTKILVNENEAELFELDENLVVEKITEVSDKSDLKVRDELINCFARGDNDTINDFGIPFMFLIYGLAYKVKEENNESHQIDDILSSWNKLIGSKCKYGLNSDGAYYCKFKSKENFLQSEETSMLVPFGIFACLRINLEFLEYQNPILEGLNEGLSRDYPEIYNAYCALSQQYDFDSTVNLGLNLPETPEEMLSYLLNMKAEKWNGVITKPDIHLPAIEVSDNVFLDTFDVPEVLNIPTKKVSIKNPFRKRKSIPTRNSRKSKKLFKAKRKKSGRLSSV